MFDIFSTRTRQIVFAARFKAGERGASLIEVDDLLHGLVLEDQGTLVENLFSKLHDGLGSPRNEAPSHIPFFSQEEAKNLVTRIEARSTATKPIGLSVEIPLSPALERAFDSAKEFQAQFHHHQIEPLHILAAILTDGYSQCAKLLNEFESRKKRH
jgi:ATP-dependent Clp protease ATP-binding subunit ClpA